METKNLLLSGLAVAFYFAGQAISRIGDAAPVVAGGVSKERLLYHGVALVLTLAAFALFVTVGIRLYRAYSK